MKRAVIVSTGSCLPQRIVPNESLEQFSAEAQHLIAEKTGVLSRRHAEDAECTSDLAIRAARRCLEDAGVSAAGIEGILLSTSSPDRMQPATAARVQAQLGAASAFAFDINSVCSGSVFGIALCDALIRSGMYRRILFVAAEMYSKILNKRDFGTFPFFGDGAGAILFSSGDNGSGVMRSCLATDGTRADAICVPGGGTMLPFERMPSVRSAYFRMRGEEVLAFTLDRGPQIIRDVLQEAGVSLADVRCFLCHQANIHIIKGIAERLSVPADRFFVNLDRYGNTASASVLIALDEAFRTNAVKRGDFIVTAAFGGGLSWGANVIRL